MTTEAVLWPTPGRASRAVKSAGTSPPCFSTRMELSFEMAADFVGESPQGRMMAKISSTGMWRIFSAVSARAKRAGVTWLTRRSVHCAERSTATSKVKGLL